MLDIKFIRKNPELIAKISRLKGVDIDISLILETDLKKSDLELKLQDLREKRNQLSKSREINDEGRILKDQIKTMEAEVRKTSELLTGLLQKVPNLPSDDTPEGIDDSENVVLRKWGAITKFNFEPKRHDELGIKLGLIDIERATKVSGSRFSYLKGDLVLMQFALVQHVFGILTNSEILEKIIKGNNLNISSNPFVPVLPPIFIKPDVYQQMGRLEPREERYHIPSDDLYLIGSAEHTLGSMHLGEIIDEKDLPIRYVGYSTSLRREAGASGRDTKGIIRQHQFDKLEMESFCLPEDSLNEQNFLVAIQEYLMQSLNIPYQVVMCCTGDMGTPDARHLDIEAWMPGEGKYRETHSADLITDYQSRRLNIKVKRENGKKELVHMNDATAFALGRTLVAIIENYQQKDGTIAIPDVLKKYLKKDFIK